MMWPGGGVIGGGAEDIGGGAWLYTMCGVPEPCGGCCIG